LTTWTNWALQLLALQNAVHGTPGMHLVCAGRVPAAQLPLPEVVRSRLAWGLCYAIRPLDDEERLAELHRQAARRGIELTASWRVTGWFTAGANATFSQNCVLDEADRLGLQKQRRVTLPLLREAVTSLDERQHARQTY
jgi:DnaA family protein